VQHENGKIETLSLEGPFLVHIGKGLDWLITSDGMEHFFTKEGYYDGWGCGVSLDPEDAERQLRQIASKREIESPTRHLT
jgi:hypothetical protein